MRYKEPPWTLGVEEEYLLVDRDSRGVATNPPDDMISECTDRLLADLVRPEFLRSQIEIGTPVCANIAEARDHLKNLRSTVAEVANKHNLAPIAASTHPFAQWTSQVHTDKERYHILARDMQAVARRLVICGMHVHVGFDDDELRIDLMDQVSYFLPHLLSLSTSSPFWRGERTGLMSYRTSVFNELPRTGLPDRFGSYADYQRHVDVLVHAGLISDASMLWWDVRPSVRFPTLEMRITDVCTRLEDTLTITALYLCILRMLWRLRGDNMRWRVYARMLIDENRWRAQRYGFDEGLVDFGQGDVVPCGDLMEELIHLTAEDAAFFGCEAEIQHSRTIQQRGTSAHRQLAVYDDAVKGGASHENALKAVVDSLITETVADL